MDRLLAFSILSSGPANISWGIRDDDKKKKKMKKDNSECEEVQRKGEEHGYGGKVQGRTRLAPEFDGLHCFETLV